VEHAGLVELIKRDPSIRLDLRYATTNNFTGRVLYGQARAFLQLVAADALVRAHRRAQADGLGLTIFDAYRPWAVTKALWDATAPAQRDYVANPAKGSRHNRGCAVDLTLHDRATGVLLEMPSAFDHFGQRAHRDYAGATPAATSNRARLAGYMEAEGFIGLSNEWWHFDYRDWADYPVLDVAFEALT
jgi:zinc D-Ala-D-Ala dipeptidase